MEQKQNIDWIADIPNFDNPYNIEFNNDGICTKCGFFHTLYDDGKKESIANCDGKFSWVKDEE